MPTENFFDHLLDENSDFQNGQLIEDCMQRFDLDCDGFLNLRELCSLTDELFSDENGTSYEFPVLIAPVIKPTTALIAIDVQNDFIDGSLAIRNCPAGQEGFEVVPVINNLLETVPFDYVFYTYDWHPKITYPLLIMNLRNFHETSLIPQEKQRFSTLLSLKVLQQLNKKLWPRHCVQNSWGQNCILN
ncbi:hypothetical protein CEXT_622451 [Caerostris extrusa]|uniref:EF-hand domain-containing protein n=1 Tax=Caerostris extrusa TaxID=172846 RepID=A0AAV4RH10_CAEEX|nr:hypothetical protein CEXT_622451 [Caerostris extrusa]